MGKCETYQEMISAEMDGELSETEELERHLASCDECRRYRELLHGMRAGFVQEEPPEEIRQSFKRETLKVYSRKKLITQLSQAAAAFAILLLGMNAVMNRSNNGKTAAVPESAPEPEYTVITGGAGNLPESVENEEAGYSALFDSEAPLLAPAPSENRARYFELWDMVYIESDENSRVTIDDEQELRRLTEILSPAEYLPSPIPDIKAEYTLIIQSGDSQFRMEIWRFDDGAIVCRNLESDEWYTAQGSFEELVSLIDKYR